MFPTVPYRKQLHVIIHYAIHMHLHCPQIFATHFQFLSPSFPPPPHCFMNLVEATMPSRTISIDNTNVLCTFHIHYASVFGPPVLACSQFVQLRMKERDLATVLTAARSQCFFHVDILLYSKTNDTCNTQKRSVQSLRTCFFHDTHASHVICNFSSCTQ